MLVLNAFTFRDGIIHQNCFDAKAWAGFLIDIYDDPK